MSRLRAGVLVALMTLAGPAAMADDRSPTDPATDTELLEFLGSVDAGADEQGADDGSWIEYLSQTDLRKITATSDPHGGPGIKHAASAAQPPASGDKKDD